MFYLPPGLDLELALIASSNGCIAIQIFPEAPPDISFEDKHIPLEILTFVPLIPVQSFSRAVTTTRQSRG